MINQAPYSQNPPHVIIPIRQSLNEIPDLRTLQTFDSKVFDQRPSSSDHDRQQQDELENDRQHQEEIDTNTNQPPQKHDARWWAYRILIGKDYYAVKEKNLEKKQNRYGHWIIHEIRYHLAEFIGTFFLVFFICGIQVNQDLFPSGGVANIDKGLASGFILTGLIYCFGRVSGAHFNPCVTLAFLFRGSFSLFRAISYIIAQFAGAVSGAAVLYHFFGNVGPGLGTTLPAPGLEHKYAVEIEMLMTYILITVILVTTKKAQLLSAIAGLAVGSTFGAIEIFAWNFTGASVNPWRSIGPTMISGVGWNTYWIYVVGPICGTVMAVIVERIMRMGKKPFWFEETGRDSGRTGEGSLAQSKLTYR